MEFPSSQPTEFFDAQEELDNDRDGLQSPPLMSPDRSEDSNFRESHSPPPQDQLPFMQLLLPPTDQFYPTLQALLVGLFYARNHPSQTSTHEVFPNRTLSQSRLRMIVHTSHDCTLVALSAISARVFQEER